MKHILKRTLAFVLTMMLLMSLVCTPAFAATLTTGNNDKTVYLSLGYSNSDLEFTEESKITSVASGEAFYIYANFSGNPTTVDVSADNKKTPQGICSYQLPITYDSAKVSVTAVWDGLVANTPNTNVAGMVTVGWMGTGSIADRRGTVYESGNLFIIACEAKTDLTLADLNAITFSSSNLVVSDGYGKFFTVVQAPALTVAAPTVTFVTASTADAIKAAIPSITFIDAAGASNVYTSESAEWADVTVALPADGLVVGENTLTATYGGCVAEFAVTVTPSIIGINVKTAPNKVAYTAFEKFDKTGMVIEAVYEDDSTSEVTGWTVDEATELTVADESWKVSYKGFETTVAITVSPKEVVAPVATESVKFNGTEQAISYTTAGDVAYFEVTGETKGTNVGSYTATAALKDKANTVWAGGNADDVTLTWEIIKADAPLDVPATAAQTLLSSAVVSEAKNYEYDLNTLIAGMPADCGAKTYAVEEDGTHVDAEIEGTTLTATVAAAAEADVTDDIKVKVSSENYEDVIVTVNFIFKSKTVLAADAIVVEDVNVTYGEAYEVAYSYANAPADAEWTLTYKKGDEVLAEAPTAAGTYTVTVDYADTVEENGVPGHVGTASATITINKLELTLADGSLAVTKVFDGEITPGTVSGALELSGVINDDDVALDMTDAVAGAYTDAAVGVDYTVEISGYALTGTAADNYSVPASYIFEGATITKELLTGTVTVAAAEGVLTATTDAPAGEYTFAWFRDGVEIEGATEATYTIADEDKGCNITVKVIATEVNFSGEIESEAYAVPAEAPEFVSVTAVGNNTIAIVNFSAKANGSAITGYEIFVDGTSVATVGPEVSSYTVSNLTNGTTYSITVAATNEIGTTTSEAVSVTPRKRTSSSSTTSSGGGATVTSSFISAKASNGGSIKSNASSAKSGETVSVDVAAKEGYKLTELIVKDYAGNVLEVTEAEDGYTFVMPKSAVTIEAKFEEIGAEEPATEPEEPTTEEPKTEEPVVAPTVGNFNDVAADSYYADAVKWVVEKGITKGISETEFAPEAACTRAQIVTFLWRAAGSPKAENAVNAFADVAADSYYADAVAWAVEKGITLGLDENTFGSDVLVDRGQTVTFLWRLAQSPAAEGEAKFGDVAADNYFGDAVAWAVAEGITNGVADDSFAPANACTRAQIVTFLNRYFAE